MILLSYFSMEPGPNPGSTVPVPELNPYIGRGVYGGGSGVSRTQTENSSKRFGQVTDSSETGGGSRRVVRSRVEARTTGDVQVLSDSPYVCVGPSP